MATRAETAKRITTAPTVTIEKGDGIRGVRVEFGTERRPGHVSVFVSDVGEEYPAQRGTIFLAMLLATVTYDGKEMFEECAGCVQPDQIDKLIAGLCFARDEAARTGIVT